ncbi:MAG: complex I subunit 1 family protein [Actinomycetota bacterium]|uniref:complex I subunit 1 family protein n=1 Tax=Euzebya rosea TaxID=2052804 RepID=UPI0013005C3B|nr:complex I subunit 1 family protein [Euzebya rosea]
MIGVIWAAVGLTVGVIGFVAVDAAVGAGVARAPIGPAVQQPWRRGALQFLQQRTTTERPDAQAWAVAPALLLGLAAVMVSVVPIAPETVLAPLSHGIVLFGAAAALVLIAVFLQGWAPNSPFPMIGGYRMFAQALSAMIPFALVLISTALPAESLGVDAIVADQEGLWNVVRQPLGLPIYLAAAVGVLFYGPLATPAGADLAGGVELEASGVQLLLWRIAHRGVVVGACAVGASVFLGGWHGPLLPGVAWVAIKTLALLAVLSTTRHLLPRVRTERYVVLAWVGLLPLALLDVFLTGWWLL